MEMKRGVLFWIWKKAKRIASAASGFVLIVRETEKGHRFMALWIANKRMPETLYKIFSEKAAPNGKNLRSKWGHRLQPQGQNPENRGSNPVSSVETGICIYGNHPKICPPQNPEKAKSGGHFSPPHL